VKAVAVGGRVYRHGFDAHFFAGANDTKCNFTAIGYQYFLEHDFCIRGLNKPPSTRFQEQVADVV
jgi:hypothetical protein